MLQACLRCSALTGTQTGKERGPGRAHILERTDGPQGRYVGWLMVINAIEKNAAEGGEMECLDRNCYFGKGEQQSLS